MPEASSTVSVRDLLIATDTRKLCADPRQLVLIGLKLDMAWCEVRARGWRQFSAAGTQFLPSVSEINKLNHSLIIYSHRKMSGETGSQVSCENA